MARGIGVKLKVEGLDEVLARARKIGGTAPKHTAAAVYLEAEEIHAEGMRQTPKSASGGWLRNTAYVTAPESLTYPVCEIGYSAEYAPYVHEIEEPVNWTTPGTGAKFLERPFLAAAMGMAQRIADYLAGKLAEESTRAAK